MAKKELPRPGFPKKFSFTAFGIAVAMPLAGSILIFIGDKLSIAQIVALVLLQLIMLISVCFITAITYRSMLKHQAFVEAASEDQ